MDLVSVDFWLNGHEICTSFLIKHILLLLHEICTSFLVKLFPYPAHKLCDKFLNEFSHLVDVICYFAHGLHIFHIVNTKAYPLCQYEILDFHNRTLSNLLYLQWVIL